MSDRFTDRLSEYLDNELAPPDRAEVEAHLEVCEACRETLGGLRRVVARAQALEDRGPADDLWPGIATRIGAAGEHHGPTSGSVLPFRRRFTISLPQLVAAGIAVAVLSGGAVWLARPQAARVAATPGATIQPPASSSAVIRAGSTGVPAAGSYDAAVADLERVLEAGRGRLDSTTIRVLEQNLALIDAALAEARRAVAADSASLYLNYHLAETMRRKLELLRRAAALVSTAS